MTLGNFGMNGRVVRQDREVTVLDLGQKMWS